MENVITISRQYGSGGHEIAKKLALALDIPFYDKQLVALAAKNSGMSEEVFKEADEHRASSLLYSLTMGTYGVDLSGMTYSPTMNDRLFSMGAQIIKDAADAGPCVIVGRCADDILRERKNVFRVFLYADRAFREKHAAECYEIEESKVHAAVSKADRERAGYYSFYANGKWGRPENYDMCLNTAALGFNNVIKLIIAGSEAKV